MGDYPPVQTATGVVIAVENVTANDIESITLRTDDGEELTIEVDESVHEHNGGLPHLQLRDRLESGEAIAVEYTYHCYEYGLIRYEDAV